MGLFADLAEPKKKTGFADLADPAPAPARASAPRENAAPTFQTNDPAAMREAIVKSGDTGLLAVFDRQFPQSQGAGAGRGLMPASAYAQPQKINEPGIPEPNRGTQTPVEPPWWQKAGAVAQAGANTVVGGAGAAVGALGGAWEAIGRNAGNAASQVIDAATGRPVTARPVYDIGESMAAGGRKFTPELPKALQTELGQEYTDAVGKFIQEQGSSVIGLGPMFKAVGSSIRPGVGALGGGVKSAMQEAFEAKKAPPIEMPRPSAAPAAAAAAPAELMPEPAAVAARAQQAAPPPITPAPRPGGGAAPLVAPPAAPLVKITLDPVEAFADKPAMGPKPVAAAEQARRAQLLQDVGLESGRRSALTGDGMSAATDVQTSKLDSPAGRHMKAQLDHEREALGNYADRLVRETGGTTLADQGADYTRGTNITHALDSIKSWYDNKITSLYKVADERAQGVPSQLDSFRTILGDDSHMTNSDRVHLRQGINAYAKKLGIVGEDGSIFSNAQQAETMRKYLNENWTPANSKFVGALKDAIDDDITRSAGEDVYKAARQMRADRGRTLDNPNGIAKIMDSSGPNGINRAVATEKIPTAISSMPVDQLAHVVETLRKAPPEAQQAAATAMAEIKAHFANQVRNIGGSQAGQYNAKGVGNYLRSNAARMAEVFTEDEMRGFRNLHEAAQILAKDQSYPGAVVQGHNLVRSGVMAGVEHGATAAGAALGGPAGAAVGGFIGKKAAQSMGERSSLKAAQDRTVRLSELPR